MSNDELDSQEQVENEKAAEKKTQEQLDIVRAYKTTFKSSDGQKVFSDLMKSCSFIRSTYSGDAMQMAHNEGRRSVLLDIITILDKSEEKILDFMKESHERKEEW